jgi:penicillin-binding protein 1B
MAKNTSSKVNTSLKPDTNTAKKGWLKWLLITSFKLSLVVVAALAIYAIYLDGKVRQKFEGQRWQVPVQVYGQVESIKLSASLNLTQLKKRLLLKGYEKVSQVNEPGQFSLSASRVIIYRRAFDFGDKYLAAIEVTIDLNKNIVQRITVDQQEVTGVYLEPSLIDRILPESKEDRVIVDLAQVPEQLIDTLLLVEDRDYYHHYGIAPLGILRALIANIQAGRTVQGGSTLTQQLVKNMFLTRQKTLWRKVNEAIMSLILEYRYSKDQLLEAYLNEVYLGQHYANGIYGFGLAAEFYFGKKIDQLTVEQMATLIGQIKGPSYYDPWRYPERAKARRDLILGLMFDYQTLSKNEYMEAIETELSVRKTRRIAKLNQPAYLQLVKRELRDLLPVALQQSGIRVFTGFDEIKQRQLTHTIQTKLPELEKAHHQKNTEVAMIVTDHQNGEVRALVGGRDQKYAGFNRALSANRQIGSLVKPAVYLAALERFEHYALGSPLADKPLSLTADNGTVWQPKNYNGKFSQQTNVFNGLINSLNVPTVNLGMHLGLKPVADMLYQLGYPHEISLKPSMLLGALNMTPYDINQIFLPIAAKGRWQKSHAITKIVSGKGNVIWQYEPVEQQVLTTQAAYLMSYSLQEVAKQGTAKSLTWLLKDKQVAGKTGTSNDQRDSWFIGFDNKHIVTTWLGQDNNTATNFTGSSGALRLFASYMNAAGAENIVFKQPKKVAQVWFDDATGQPYKTRCADSTLYPTHVLSYPDKLTCQQKHEEDKNWFERLFSD